MIDRGGSNRRGNVCLPFWGTFHLDLSLATASSSHKVCFPVRITGKVCLPIRDLSFATASCTSNKVCLPIRGSGNKVCLPIRGSGNKLFLPFRDLSLATTGTAGNKVQCILLMEELFLCKVPAHTSQRTNGWSNVGQ